MPAVMRCMARGCVAVCWAFLSAPFLQGMLEGGVPIVKDGQVIGAVGVSGVKAADDAKVARAGIAALGL